VEWYVLRVGRPGIELVIKTIPAGCGNAANR
jgi:hypothetical protein